MLATVLLTVLLTAALAWWVTAGLTARWDIRKKRQEFDLVLVKEFYELIGSFKSVAREAEALGPRPPPAGRAATPEQGEADTAPATPAAQPGVQPATPSPLATWETKQAALAQRALETEMKMEAILLKLISEGPSDAGMSPAEWRRQRHVAGLLRQLADSGGKEGSPILRLRCSRGWLYDSKRRSERLRRRCWRCCL